MKSTNLTDQQKGFIELILSYEYEDLETQNNSLAEWQLLTSKILNALNGNDQSDFLGTLKCIVDPDTTFNQMYKNVQQEYPLVNDLYIEIIRYIDKQLTLNMLNKKLNFTPLQCGWDPNLACSKLL